MRVLIVNQGIITPFKFPNRIVFYSSLDILFIQVYIIYLDYGFKIRPAAALTNGLFKYVIINLSDYEYEVDKINLLKYKKNEENRKIILNITFIRLY